MTRWRRVALALTSVTFLGAFAGYLVLRSPPGPRSTRVFDPDRMAELEVGMWRAYYRKERLRLFSLLVTLLHEQYRYSWASATRSAFHLARAAVSFGDARSGYERVLPDLEVSYRMSRDWTGARYDPAAVARAELAWWVARRVPAESDPENVGRLIGKMYALYYDVPEDRVGEAGLLRARAGYLRDQAGADADWETVSRLLHASYQSLHAAVSADAEARPPASSRGQ